MSLRATLLALPALLLCAAAQAGGSADAPVPPQVDLSAVPASAVGSPPGQGDKPHPVTARLLAEQAVATPGGRLALGVHLQQEAHWHTYWKTPGDIGLPTTITWTLPPGTAPTPHVFPLPTRYEQEGMVSYGYDDQVLHISEVTLPADLAPGTYEVSAAVEWLVCKTSCIPGAVTLTLPITVGATEAPAPWAPLFGHFRARWPTPLDAASPLTVRAALDASPIVPGQPFRAVFHVTAAPGHTLTVPGAELWPTFTPITGQEWMVDPKVELVPTADGLFVVVPATTFAPDPLPTADAVGGLLQVQVDGAWVRTEVTRPLTWAAAGTPRSPEDPALWAALEAARTPAVAASAPPTADAAPIARPADAAAISPLLLLTNLLAAFIGGLILNVMPCVLPVLMLKLYGLVDQVGITDGQKRTAGLAYTGGILASFWLLAFAVWVARAALGNEVGWGFQMQYPGYVAGLTTLVFLFSLSLFGVFEIPAFGAEQATELSSQEGVGGYFFTGVFATLVATPCSAPILGTAIAFAFQAPIWMLVLAFTFIGLGLASPFLLIAFVPAAYRLLPQPGPWMETFKQLIGFTLVATCVWLLGVLTGLVGDDRALDFLAFLTTVALGAWIYGHWGGVAAEGRRQLAAAAAGLLVATAGGWTFVDLTYAEEPTCDDGAVSADLDFTGHIPWQRFSDERVAALSGKVLFIDFTADWCVSCKVNEKTVLETRAVREAMARHGVVPLVADWTRRDERITAWLRKHDRAGVPMYLVIPPAGPDGAELLPEVITPGMVVDALDRAATATARL